MRWIELAIEVPPEHLEGTCSLLAEIVPGGCSIEEPVQLLGPEEGFRRLPNRPATVKVYLPADDRIGARLDEVREAMAGAEFTATWIEQSVDEDDWANAWKAFFHVERIGRGFVIRPSWEAYEAQPDDVVLNLDPGMAFGTGQHETTRMCLEAVEELVQPGTAVLDLGCGSGILAVAAALAGAERVDAVDLESVAVEATQANATRNGVGDRVRVAEGSLDERWPFGPLPDGAYDVVVANIHAGAVALLAPAIFAALHAGGALAGSGIIAERLPMVLGALAAAGFAEPEVHSAGEWRTVIARRSNR